MASSTQARSLWLNLHGRCRADKNSEQVGMEASFDLKAEQLPWRSAEVAFLYLADVAEGEGEE